MIWPGWRARAAHKLRFLGVAAVSAAIVLVVLAAASAASIGRSGDYRAGLVALPSPSPSPARAAPAFRLESLAAAPAFTITGGTLTVGTQHHLVSLRYRLTDDPDQARARLAPVRPLLLGFGDEQSFLWAADRLQMLDLAVSHRARLIRVIANWSQIAPTRPRNASDVNDPAYHFEGVDDLAWQAQLRGMRLLVTIWGTPRWASPTGSPNAHPKPADLGAFCSALATRFSGRHGRPPVNLYSVWNEPNLEEALSPQFNNDGSDASPHLYAQLFRACRGAIKRANANARVALGETSPRGHNILTGQPSHSPGGFAKLLSRERPALRFDAWAHHPYPVGVDGKPTTGQAWPSVGIGGLRQFESRLQQWFDRPTVPLWITEFAYQTSPEVALAPSYALQASYLGQALQAALAVPEVELFSWYILRDTPRKPHQWQCGLVTGANAPKPSLAAYSHLAAAYDSENPTLVIAAGPRPVVPLSVIAFQARALPGDPPIGITYRVRHRGRLLSGAELATVIDPHGQIAVRLAFRPQPRHTYMVTFDLNDIHGNTAHRRARLIVHSPPG